MRICLFKKITLQPQEPIAIYFTSGESLVVPLLQQKESLKRPVKAKRLPSAISPPQIPLIPPSTRPKTEFSAPLIFTSRRGSYKPLAESEPFLFPLVPLLTSNVIIDNVSLLGTRLVFDIVDTTTPRISKKQRFFQFQDSRQYSITVKIRATDLSKPYSGNFIVSLFDAGTLLQINQLTVTATSLPQSFGVVYTSSPNSQLAVIYDANQNTIVTNITAITEIIPS